MAGAYASLMLIGKFAEVQGMFRFVSSRALGRRSQLIDYKQHETT